MSLNDIRAALPAHAKDLKLNLDSVLTEEGAPGLGREQIHAIAIASALGARSPALADALIEAAELPEATVEAARAAAAIMGMNNVYYRFTHLVENEEYRRMPARLRMNAMANPGVDKAEFELYSIAVSAINGCGMCVDSHEKTLQKHGVGAQAIQSAVRIAAVINAVAAVLDTTAPEGLRRAA